MVEPISLEKARRERAESAARKNAEEVLILFFGADDSPFKFRLDDDANKPAAPEK